jgi:DNA polymerase III subunit delta
MDALAFLEKAAKSKRQPVYVLLGDEDFLKRHVREAINSLVLGEIEHDLAVSPFGGEKLDFATVRDELDTLPFIGPARVVVVEGADPFVTNCRESLEKYVAKPSKVGVLILDVKTFPETTKLAKALPDASKIVCKAPAPNKLPDWCVGWAKTKLGKKLDPDAAHFLVELVGPQMGLLAQELDKLSVSIGTAPAITHETIDTYVGRSRSANVFHILDAIGENNAAKAFQLLTELFDEGEDPFGIAGVLGSQLRKLATVGRLLTEGQTLITAMDNAGVGKWPQARQSFEKQVKHLGRRRLDRILEWLVELQVGLRGGNALPERVQVERLVSQLARPREAS